MLRRLLPLLLTPLLLANAPASVEGTWRTDDGKGLVRIGRCGAQTCGWIASVLDKRPGVPSTDVNNPDAKLRGRPLLGLATLTGFTRDGAVWKGGRAYDPKTGRSYRATLELNPDGSLKVTGCVLVICRSLRWTRAG
ncbi:DUF2147 domain-containing protein [Novosphingobium sp. JCM 18896]|uniref:DUF2147 domain-containing protein n=1 Tax=Novosphingobium sp. JCM 18896 TaxID=2989731 RepID=UPI002222CBD6|nr:DUF2147 domain-containing protein [Novosphingobium sp. JCM 18896]MCW1431014.1 DUF2147 domain-containing protein [Novosphingobium sp. JCM 18896]